MHGKALIFSMVFLIFLWLALPAMADDPGIPDTVRVESLQIDPDPVNPIAFPVEVTLFNDEELAATSLGMYYDSDDIDIDSITVDGGSMEHLTILQHVIDPDSNRLVVVGVKLMEPVGIVPGDSLLATLWFTLDAGAPDQVITIDSGFVPPAAPFILTNLDGTSLKPQFIAGEITVGEGIPPQPTIELSPDSFAFEATIGDPNPQPQVLNITNVGEGDLFWNASWDAGWLNVSPSSGIAPSNPGVYVNLAGLSAGVYTDSIMVSDPNATNDPQYATVTFTVNEPLPEIELVPDEFYFLALQDSANPDIQTLVVNDVGGGTLSWTATNSSMWLSLSAYSGGPGDAVDLMVDITGLTFGTYYDTIVVSDPNATNSPQYAEVVLEVISAFPVLEVEPLSYQVGGSITQNPYDRILKIINGGGGSLNFDITATNEWISFQPSTGSTMGVEEVVVSFETIGMNQGFHYDTIVVTSTNGTGGPYEIPVQLWVMQWPPELEVIGDQLSFSGVQCQNIPPIPSQTFEIQNNGIESLDWTLEWDADWLIPDPSSGPNNALVEVSVDESGLAPGTYTDTIKVVSTWSLTPPDYVEVSFTVNSPTDPTELAVSVDSLAFIFLAGDVGLTVNPTLIINNAVSGCMDWYITDPYPWMTFEPDSGTNFQEVNTNVVGAGLPLGITPGEFVIHAPGSVNDSVVVEFNVYIAQFGDANCDGNIDVTDAVYVIYYAFAAGYPKPIPREWAGDCNCDRMVDVSDAVYILNYSFGGGPTPCTYDPFIIP